jgi:hypothetical protein
MYPYSSNSTQFCSPSGYTQIWDEIEIRGSNLGPKYSMALGIDFLGTCEIPLTQESIPHLHVEAQDCNMPLN